MEAYKKILILPDPDKPEPEFCQNTQDFIDKSLKGLNDCFDQYLVAEDYPADTNFFILVKVKTQHVSLF